MDHKVIRELQDLRHLQWSHVRSSSGTAGTFLKAQSVLSGKKIYYKLSKYDSEQGIIGHECVNEIIVDRLLTLLGIEHLSYELIHALIAIEGKEYETYLCASYDFKKKGEKKAALDNYYEVNKQLGESHYDFCVRSGWQEDVDAMLAIDYLILNRDRHGANIEVLRNVRAHTIRMAPMFDHGLSLLCSCMTNGEIEGFDVAEDKPCQNFIGGRSTWENLALINEKARVFQRKLREEDRAYLFDGLEGVLTEMHLNKIWDMLYTRWCRYEMLCDDRS